MPRPPRTAELAGHLQQLRDRADREAERRDWMLDLLLSACEGLVDARTLGEVERRAADALRRLVGCDRCRLVRFADSALVQLDDPASRPDLLEAEVAAAASSLQLGAARFVTQSAASVGGADEQAAQTVSALALPIALDDGGAAVAICSWSERLAWLPRLTVRHALLLGRAVALAIARCDALQRVSYVTETCSLTGAHTRRSLEGLLEALRARSTPHTLVLIDLDGFGDYNARLGRQAGDRLLVALAGLVARECRAGDVVARSGPDEFALVLHGSTVDAGTATALRIVSAVADWGHEDVITVCAGVAGVIAESRADALALATAALGRAKAEGEGGSVGVA